MASPSIAPSSSIKVSDLNQTHPDYKILRDTWDQLQILNAGGLYLKQNAAKFLIKRPKENTDVYAARCQNIVGGGIFGSIVGWYVAKLFQQDPNIADDATATDGNASGFADDYYSEFLKDADRSGTSLVDFFRQQVMNWFLYRCSYVLVDLPTQPEQGPANLADQQKAGLDQPYLCNWDPLSVINWELDDYGAFNWVVIRCDKSEQETPFDKAKRYTYWYIYDRQNFYVYRAEIKDASPGTTPTVVSNYDGGEDAVAQLAPNGTGKHALSNKNQVPLRRFMVPDRLWLGNRVLLQLRDHLNEENALAWGLFNACLAMPVIKSDEWDDKTVTITEQTYIKLEKGGEFEWAEPEGRSFEQTTKRIGDLREEIYRASYLQSQGRSSAATPAMQSGYSKELDLQPSNDVLNEYGDCIRASMQLILEDVCAARVDTTTEPDVNGFAFEKKPLMQDIEVAERLQGLQIPSDTLEKEYQIETALSFLEGRNQAIKDKVETEIRKAPTQSERMAAEEAKQNAMFDQGLSKQIKQQSAEQDYVAA